MSSRDCILVTGAAGFIGSHFARLAVEAGSKVVLLDSTLDWPAWPVPEDSAYRWYGDIADRDLVDRLIRQCHVTSVVHFAGEICVAESIKDPARYYDRNVMRSLAFLEAVRQAGVQPFVFSSSAAVYGTGFSRWSESARCAPINPYGATKLAIEQALEAYGNAYGLKWAALRYFNAAGAHPTGSMRESHKPETHLIPLAIDAALGRAPVLTVFGDDHSTRDGTCERDYVHVCDLAQAHLDALDALDRRGTVGTVNLGGGLGFTVREVLASVENVLGREVPHSIGPRRPGDPASLLAVCDRAVGILGWAPKRSNMPTIIEDAIRSRRSG